MSNGLAKKVIMIGFDGGNWPFIERFIREGRLPNLASLMDNGVYSESLPVMPCDTPTNWSTLVTGAWPGTHGITSFHIHLPGEPLNKVHFSVRSYWSQAEFLWDAAERAGKRTASIMWPLSFPPTCKTGIFIDGTGPRDPHWRVAYDTLYSTNPLPPGHRHRGDIPVKLIEAHGWKNTPRSSSPPLETTVRVIGVEEAVIWTERGAEVLEGESLTSKKSPSVSHQVLVLDSEGKGYDRVLIGLEKDASKPVADLTLGKWSDWVYESLEKKLPSALARFDFRDVPEGVFPSYFKYKLTELSPDATAFSLYRTDIWMATQWAFPEGIAEELIEKVGPFIEGLELPGATVPRGDWETYLECIDMQVDWQVRAAKYLDETYHPELLLVQIHAQDGINHQMGRAIDEDNPSYDPEEAELGWEIFARTYEDVDNLVGGVVKDCADEKTLVVVVSDHGCIPVYKLAWLGVPLMRNGLLSYKTDPETGKTVIDWTRTKAYPWRTFVHVNLKGRDPDGIVTPEEYETVREEVLRAVYSMRDPDTDECPIALALRKEDAEALGQWGERFGDIIYYLKPGYTDVDLDRDNALKLSVEDLKKLKDVALSTEIIEHHNFLPTAKTDHMWNRAVFFMKGPGVKKKYQRKTPIWQVDVTPTICYALGINPPSQCDGKVVHDFFEAT
ncbi:MAG: alkaline phosphatase family protein [Candidatus Bathyarchaeota archaeon]|nr:alkaline phosphatase family protein [Candidatus Bathyarchaeota archaeon]